MSRSHPLYKHMINKKYYHFQEMNINSIEIDWNNVFMIR